MTERQAKLLDEAFAAFKDEIGPLVRPEGPGAVQRTVRRRRRGRAARGRDQAERGDGGDEE